jgi:hypothetical protein
MCVGVVAATTPKPMLTFLQPVPRHIDKLKDICENQWHPQPVGANASVQQLISGVASTRIVDPNMDTLLRNASLTKGEIDSPCSRFVATNAKVTLCSYYKKCEVTPRLAIVVIRTIAPK